MTNANPCPARVGTLRCRLRAGHAGEHVNFRGHRYWGHATDILAELSADLWQQALRRRERAHDDTPRQRQEA
jgi:hypothetical protein